MFKISCSGVSGYIYKIVPYEKKLLLYLMLCYKTKPSPSNAVTELNGAHLLNVADC
jgi:hypothetical protein